MERVALPSTRTPLYNKTQQGNISKTVIKLSAYSKNND